MTSTLARRLAGRRHTLLLGIAIALLAFNLRPAVASVGPVLPEIREGLGLGGGQTAVLTMLPVLCFGLPALAAPRLARRAGIEPVLMGVLLALVAALVGRVLGGPSLLFAGTVLVGCAIAVANVLVPSLVKRDFPEHTGAMMGVYTASVASSAAVAAGATVPVGQLLDLGWRGALGVWAAPVAVAAVVWLPRLRGYTRPQPVAVGRTMLGSPLAWQVTVFFGLQSMVFYAVLAWLPSIYRDHGYGATEAGLVLSVSGLVQIPVTLFLPGIATRAANQVGYIIAATALFGAGLAGVLIAPTAAPYLWSLIIGAGAGSCFALALALFVLRVRHAADTARLGAMAQSIGYLISACGPLLVGVLHEATGSWTAPLWMLLLLLVPQLWCGVLAGRARWIGSGPAPAQQAE